MESANKQIEALLEEVDKIAINEVKRLALVILNENPTKCGEFMMAMGTFFFIRPNGEIIRNYNKEEILKIKGYKELDDFIMRWNSKLKLTGEPMRFKKDGIVTTDW